MILVAGGDSFTFGNELQNQLNAYSALLAKKSNMDYFCAAFPGNANSAIGRMTVSAAEKLKNQNQLFGVIVTWTFTNRYEFRFNYNTKQKISPWYTINAWSIVDQVETIKKSFHNHNEHILDAHKTHIRTAEETGITEFAKIFYKHVGDNEYYELYSSFKEMLFLQYYLKQNNIPYLFLAADNHFYNHDNYFRRKDEFIDSLYNQIDWNSWFFFEGGKDFDQTKELRGFYQWAVENKYPIGTTHPLEEAHAAAAELIKDKFNELVTKPLEQNKVRN